MFGGSFMGGVVPSLVTQPTNQGVYWVGADNNIYTRVAGQNGVRNLGPAGVAALPGGLTHIADPNPPRPAAPAAVAPNQQPTTNTGGSGPQNNGVIYGSGNTGGSGSAAAAPAVVYPDKSNDIAMQNAGLGQVGNTEATGIKAIEDAWAKINGQYQDDLNGAHNEYSNQSTENTKDLQTNKQTALETGVAGRQGLFGTLASLGALNGTGIDLANRAVQKGANEDLTTAANTYATNQNSLDSGYNAYTQQEKRLQDQAQTARANNEQQVHNDAAKSRQAYLTNIANDYQDEGKTADAKTYANQAAALFPQIASTNVPTISLGYTGGAYTAPTLSSYVSKANNTSVQTTPPVPGANTLFNIPGLMALNRKAGS